MRGGRDTLWRHVEWVSGAEGCAKRQGRLEERLCFQGRGTCDWSMSLTAVIIATLFCG